MRGQSSVGRRRAVSAVPKRLRRDHSLGAVLSLLAGLLGTPVSAETLQQALAQVVECAQLCVQRSGLAGVDAVYLTGQLPLSALQGPDELVRGELDRVLGTAYAYSEECFPTAMQIGFASRFRR